MNNLDSMLYKALKFFDTYSRTKIDNINENDNKKFYRKYVPEDVETTLIAWKYIDLKGNSRFIITQNGLEQLRQLKSIRNKDLTLAAAVIALLISIYNFFKN